ncbi:MAG: ferrous iron transport protein A [Armatimonadetes bacterium]|nr:ferrous iron transport protein A [Armatimonadota bacterium]
MKTSADPPKSYAPVQSPASYQCPLCGFQFEFDPARNTGGCSSCPLGKGCGLVLCPNCRYEFPEESQIVSWFSRLFKRAQSRSTEPLWEDAPGVIPLSELAAGKTGEIVAIESERRNRADRLSAMGLTPGSRVRVKQRFPSVVIEIGETEIALDRAITEDIRVRPVADA